MTWATRARVIRSRRAMATWLGASPDSRRACHSRALRRSSTTRGVRGSFGGLGFPRGGGMAGDHLVGGHPARQAAHVAVFEGPLGPQGDLDRLFAVGGHGRAVRAVHGDMDDAEPDLGLGEAGPAVSRPIHSGSQRSAWPLRPSNFPQPPAGARINGASREKKRGRDRWRPPRLLPLPKGSSPTKTHPPPKTLPRADGSAQPPPTSYRTTGPLHR